jgi:single-stranded DNA-binding protein
MNKVILVGTLVSNPESKDVNGLLLCNFMLEVKHESQAGKEEVMKFPVTVFSGQAQSCMLYLKSGSRAMIEGRMTCNPKEDNMWAVRASSVIFLDQKDK